jgi:L-asparaginase II
MASSFAKLINPPEIFDKKLKGACQRIVSAKINYPELVGGTDRLDTILMQAAKGRIVSKIGAEGVWLCGVLPCEKWRAGLGIAFKIEDGDDKRARAAISVEVLRQIEILSAEDLQDYSPLPIKNRRGDTVGKVEPKFNLRIATENTEIFEI